MERLSQNTTDTGKADYDAHDNTIDISRADFVGNLEILKIFSESDENKLIGFNEIGKPFNNMLRTRRTVLGITQRDIATSVSLSTQYIGKFEALQAFPENKKIRNSIARLLDLEPSAIFPDWLKEFSSMKPEEASTEEYADRKTLLEAQRVITTFGTTEVDPQEEAEKRDRQDIVRDILRKKPDLNENQRYILSHRLLSPQNHLTRAQTAGDLHLSVARIGQIEEEIRNYLWRYPHRERFEGYEEFERDAVRKREKYTIIEKNVQIPHIINTEETNLDDIQSIKRAIVRDIEMYKKQGEIHSGILRSFPRYMLIAQLKAIEALEKKGNVKEASNYGVGAVLVIWYKGRDYIFAAGNEVFSNQNPIGHAENRLIRSLQILGRKNLTAVEELNSLENFYEVNTIGEEYVDKEMQIMIITTVQPCTMICEPSIIAHNRTGGVSIQMVIWGTHDLVSGGFTPESMKRYPATWQGEFKKIQAEQLTDTFYTNYIKSHTYLPFLPQHTSPQIEAYSSRIYEQLNTVEKQNPDARLIHAQDIKQLTMIRLDGIYKNFR